MASIKKNYFYNTLNTISGMLFPLITFPYVARVLMPEGIGLVNFYNAIISYITLFCSLGIPLYALRETARARHNPIQLAKTTSEILLLNAIFASIGYIIVFILTLTVPQIKEHRLLFLLMSTNIFFVTIGCEWFYQGIEDFKYITLRSLLIKVVCLILLFILVRNKSDIIYYGLYLTIGVVGGNIINFFRLRKYIYYKKINLRKLNPFSHLEGAAKIFLLTVIGSIYLQLDSVMLGFMSGNSSVGYYSSAIKLVKLIMGIVTSLGLVLLPRLSSLPDDDDSVFNELLEKSFNFVVMLSLPLVVGLILLSNPLIFIFCGNAYEQAINPLRVLTPIIFFIGLSYIAAQANFAKGKENITIIIGLIGAITDVILNVILIPRLAALGAAVATSITEGLILLIYIFIYLRTLKRIPFNGRHFINCIFGCIVMSLIALTLQKVIVSNIVQIIIIPISGCVIYLLTLYFLKDEPLIRITSTIRKKQNK